MTQNGKLLKDIIANLDKPTRVRTPRNQWQTPGEVTDINSRFITMQGVGFDAIGVSPDGTTQYMQDGMNYAFPTAPVREFSLMKAKTGGSLRNGLLSRTVTCSSCGHSWKAVEGGLDPLMCHKCGGMVKMQVGGSLPEYQQAGSVNILNVGFGKRCAMGSDAGGDCVGGAATVGYDDMQKQLWKERTNLYQDVSDREGKKARRAQYEQALAANPGLTPEMFAMADWDAWSLNSGFKNYGKNIDPVTNMIPDSISAPSQFKHFINNKLIKNTGTPVTPQDMINYYNQLEGGFEGGYKPLFMQGYQQKAYGGMIRRKDGSYSRRGLWDNIRANKGSGKKPTKEMLEQERKIRAEEKQLGGLINNTDMYNYNDPFIMAEGGINNPGFQALPPKVQAKIISNMAYGGYAEGDDLYEMGRGGYTVSRSNDRKGKTHKVTGPDGTVKYFGDAKLGQHPKDPARKKAFYARHKKNLAANPYFRAFARATWADGGETEMMDMSYPYMAGGGEPNGEMALGQMASVSDKMNKLRQFIGVDDNLDPWIASKLAVMDHSADAISDYLMYGPNAEQNVMKKGGHTYANGVWYDMGGYIPEGMYGYGMADGGSIVDYLNSKGMATDKAFRAKLAQEKGVKNYDYSAEKNTELLNILKNEGMLLKNKGGVKDPASKGLPNKNKNSMTPVSYQPSARAAMDNTRVAPGYIDKSPIPTPKDARLGLESGTVVDKGTNTLYVINKGKVTKSSPVLTGQAGKDINKDPNANPYPVSYLENNPQDRSTPTGTYFMKPNANIYGYPGFNLKGIPAYGLTAPSAGYTAIHATYGIQPKPGMKGHADPEEYRRRNAAYSQSPDKRYMSYGCTNMQGEQVDCLSQTFPQGDTAIYIDSRKLADMEYMKQLKRKAEGGPADPEVRWHSEWEQDPYAQYSGQPTEDEIIAAQDAQNVAANPMAPVGIRIAQQAPAKAPAKRGYNAGSIVDFLNSQGAKSDFATRKALAEKVYGFKNYTGTAAQNKMLLEIMSGKKSSSAAMKGYNEKDGNMLRKGFDRSFEGRSPNFDKPGSQAEADNSQQKQPAGRKPLFGITADEYIERDPYFFAEEGDNAFVKALDTPFTFLRNQGARLVLDQDPMALLTLLGLGLGSRGLIGRTQTMPYNPRQIGAPGRIPGQRALPGRSTPAPTGAGQKALPGRSTPTGWSTESGLRSGQYPMRAEGGYVEGQEIEITDPEQLRMLQESGYTYEII